MKPSVVNKHPAAFMLRAFSSRNYRLFFCGQIVSLSGSWITTTATAWLVYRLTGSAFLLGLVGFSTQLPALLLLPFAGYVVDRKNRHRILLLTQTLSMLQSFALAALTLTHQINVPWLLALCAFQGMINAFDMPCRQAFIVELVENKTDLGNAIALNSSMFNAARLAGPAIGGLIITTVGEGWCFLIDGVSYGAVIAALTAMRLKPRAIPPKTGSFPAHFGEGWKYAIASKPILSIISLLALMNLFGVSYTVLLPVFAGSVLKGGPHTLGFLMSAIGAGALLGALWLASRQSVLGLGRVIAFASAVFGTALITFSLSKILWLSLVILVAGGAGVMLQMASCNTILQTIVDDDKRGRIMSLYVMAVVGTAPFGSLLAGFLSDRIGAPNALFFCGVICLSGAFWFYRQLPGIRKVVRPIYANLGIIPAEVTA